MRTEESRRRHTISVEREHEDGKEELRCAQGDHEIHAHCGYVLLYRAAGMKECGEFVATARQSTLCLCRPPEAAILRRRSVS